MSILKSISEIFKLAFADNGFVKSFSNVINPPKNYQKEIAENLAKIKSELQK